MGLMWVRSMLLELMWGRCRAYLWGKGCCVADVGQIYGAGAAVGQMWVRTMGQELLWLMWASSMGQEML